MKKTTISAAVLALAAPFAIQPATGQIAVSANDGKVRMENGVVRTVPNNPDTVAIIDLKAKPPKLAPNSTKPTKPCPNSKGR